MLGHDSGADLSLFAILSAIICRPDDEDEALYIVPKVENVIIGSSLCHESSSGIQTSVISTSRTEGPTKLKLSSEGRDCKH